MDLARFWLRKNGLGDKTPENPAKQGTKTVASLQNPRSHYFELKPSSPNRRFQAKNALADISINYDLQTFFIVLK